MHLPIGRWLSRIRRDVRFAAGARVPPFAPRAATRAGTAVLPTRRLVVREIVRETADAATLWLADPSGAPIPFVAGQFFTLHVRVGGETVRRAYSAMSSPRDPSRVGVTVKRIAGGRASTYLVENARAGDAFDVLGPSGSFTLAPDPAARRAIVLVGGGSGITPLMAILGEVLAVERESRVALVYGNRREEDVIFARALAELARENPERFALRHVYGAALDAARFARELDAIDAPDAEHFVCGPEPMMRVARDVLAARGVPAEKIHEERFLSPELRAAHRAPARAGARVTVRLAGREHTVDVAPGRTLLEAGLAADVPMPFSCALGGCGACRVRVTKGTVEMDEPTCLTSEERAKGFALACVGTPSDGAVVEVA